MSKLFFSFKILGLNIVLLHEKQAYKEGGGYPFECNDYSTSSNLE